LEESALRRDFGVTGANFTQVPNGIERLATPVPGAQRRGILVVGRIEERKRQLELLRHAEKKNVGLTFIGPANANSSTYAKTFAGEVAVSRHSTWLGALTHEAVMAQMSRARVVLNLSWVEVQSLVELEAVASGCFVVAGSSGGNAAQFPDLVRAVHPADIEQAFRLVRDLESKEPPVAPVQYPSWADVARGLAQVYEEALSR
jgi:glycosyltransferase involved in cell wall biosynthesis